MDNNIKNIAKAAALAAVKAVFIKIITSAFKTKLDN